MAPSSKTAMARCCSTQVGIRSKRTYSRTGLQQRRNTPSPKPTSRTFTTTAWAAPQHWSGAAALERRHIPVYAIPATIELARSTHQPAIPDHPLNLPSTPSPIAKDALIFFPGGGHTKDNVVVYFPKERVLFGGCFIKDSKATGLGNIADADLAAWPAALERTQAAFPQIETVIPGHGPMDPRALTHTRDLLKQPPA